MARDPSSAVRFRCAAKGSVKGLLSVLWRGAGLRHCPIALSEHDPLPVRFELHRPDAAPLDVTQDQVPVSLRPLILGIRVPRVTARCAIVVRDASSGERLGEIECEPSGTIPLTSGELSLFRTIGCKNVTARAPVRWWRYTAAWVHAQRASSRGDRLCMSAADLRCLNVYYTAPRPVYLVGVGARGYSNLFPMDLVGFVGSGDFLLALRATSPAIDLMEESRIIAMSAAPADYVTEVYALGSHHRKANVDVSALPFSVRQSPLHRLPIVAGGLVRELTVTASHRIGSHVLFVCRVDAERGDTYRQMAHMSQMYVEWLATRGRQVETLK